MKRFTLALFVALLLAPAVSEGVTRIYLLTTSLTRSFDQGWTVDSCVVAVQTGKNPSNLDSAMRLTTLMVDPIHTGATKDTLWRYAAIAVTELHASRLYNPSAMGFWYLSDGRVMRDRCDFTFVSGHVDSIGAGSVTASVDSASVARSVWNDAIIALASRTVTTSASGAGGTADSILVLNSADSTILGAGVDVWIYPNGGGGAFQNRTDANGWAIFSVVVDTYYVYAWTAGYYQTTVPDTNAVVAPVKDTIFMTVRSATAPSTPALTAVDFYFYNGKGEAVPEVIVTYSLVVDRGSELHHLDSTKSINPGRIAAVRSTSTGKATIQVIPNDSIVVAPNEVGTTRYRIEALDPETGLPLFGDDGILIAVPASASGLTYPTDF